MSRCHFISGLHRVRPGAGLIRRQSVLPPGLFARLDVLSFGRDLADSRANVITARPDRRPATAQ
jgi:sulfotransferase